MTTRATACLATAVLMQAACASYVGVGGGAELPFKLAFPSSSSSSPGPLPLLYTSDTSDPSHTVLSVPPSCNPKCTAAIQQAISACAATGGSPPCTVSLEAATYTLDGPSKSTLLSVNSATNFALVGQGEGSTELLLTDIAQLLVINGGANQTYSGFSVDMQRLPFTYGQVESANKTASVVVFDSSPPLYAVDTARYPWLLAAQGVLSYDPVGRRVSPDSPTDIYALTDPLPVVYTNVTNGAGSLLTVVGATLKPGDWVIIRHQTYSFNAFSAFSVGGIRVVNVTLFAIAGMGVFTHECTTEVTVLGLHIVRKHGTRPMSITADGMHIQDTRGAPITIVGCTLEGQGDDGLNTPTIFEAITAVSADGSVLTVEGRGGSGPPVVHSGDLMNVFNRSTLALLGQVLVETAYDNGTLVLGGPLPAGAGLYDVINSAASYASTLTLTDNLFQGNRARGGLIKTSNAFIARNSFVNVSGPALKSETDGCYWDEGHPVSNWTVVDNTFVGVNYAVAQMPGDVMIDNSVPIFQNGAPTTTCTFYSGPANSVQHNLTFQGNVWQQLSGQSAINAESVGGLTLVGNTVTRQSGAKVPAADFAGEGVTGAAVSGNTCDGAACTTSGL
jgi:hypothetical protein